jgi:hypothetical protein
MFKVSVNGFFFPCNIIKDFGHLVRISFLTIDNIEVLTTVENNKIFSVVKDEDEEMFIPLPKLLNDYGWKQ